MWREYLQRVIRLLGRGRGDPAEQIGSVLKGRMTQGRYDRLSALFERERQPSPIEIFRAWQGPGSPSAVAARERVDWAAVDGFDPAADSWRTSRKAIVGLAYDRAHEQGYEDEATYLRVLDGGEQAGFANLLHWGFVTS